MMTVLSPKPSWKFKRHKLSSAQILSLLYPYAHLSSESGVPRVGKSILQKLERDVAELGLSMHHVPFGWNKALTMKVKGHPLAEQSKFLKPSKDLRSARKKAEKETEVVSAALKAEDTLKSQWFVIDLDGNLTPCWRISISLNTRRWRN